MSRLGIKRRAWLVIRELVEPFFKDRSLAQETCDGITGKLCRQSADCVASPRANAIRAVGCLRFQFCKSTPQSPSVELVDREHSNAALRASRTAHQPRAASSSGLGQCGVHDLNQLGIARVAWLAAHFS